MFDEIQNVNEWEIFVRSGFDREKKFVITGSNVSLPSGELGTRLTGRHIIVELFPFSFSEFLDIRNEELSPITFKEYNEEGCFPIYLKSRKPETLRQLLKDIVQRDIVSRYNLRSSKILMEMALYLINIGREFSYSNLARTYNMGSYKYRYIICFISGGQLPPVYDSEILFLLKEATGKSQEDPFNR